MAKFNVIVNIKDSDEKLQEFDIVLNKKEETPTEDEGALECINTVLINEYNIERNKRTSFENRALGILAFNSAILSIFLNKYKILVLKAGLQKALTYYLFIKIPDFNIG